MPSSKDSPNRNETFGRLLSGAINSIATYEGKTAPIIEEELGALAIVAGKTIQRYKAGHLPPEHETVKVLAEAAVRRGFLDREWLEHFLHAARYPFAAKLLDQLRPVGMVKTRPPRSYENLPAPTYNQFVPRAQAFAEVIDGLQQRSAVVLIVGLGGNGKTSLAREVAAQCLQDSGDGPRFDAVVWVSDKDRPGTTNLSTVLDEIARTLDYPGFTQYAHDDKLYEVGQLLKRQRVLIVIDNFETIADSALLAWLLRLPEPSKALITSREKHRGLWSSWLAELRGMSEAEAQILIHQRLCALQLNKLASNPADFEPLTAVTGGNPKAIEIALGLVKHERRPLQHVVDDLHAARGELFDDLFTRAWALLDEATRRVLLVMTFFPASASGEALAATADVQGFAFDRTVERLSDLALLDVQQENLNSAPRYTLHPLVRAFAGIKLADHPILAVVAKERLIKWYRVLTSQIGFCWDDLARLELLDSEQETVFVTITYAWELQDQCYDDFINLVLGASYYYQVRGGWKSRIKIEKMRLDAAQKQYNIPEIILATRNFVEGLSRLGDLEEAKKYVEQLQILSYSMDVSESRDYKIPTVLGIYWTMRQNYRNGRQILQEALSDDASTSFIHRIFNRRWLAYCLYKDGDLEKARQMFHEVLLLAEGGNYIRNIIYAQVNLAEIDIDQGNLFAAREMLDLVSPLAQQYQDRERLALIQYAYARLHLLHGDLPAAHTALVEAIDLFERLGMRPELKEARMNMIDLDDREQITAVG